MGLRILVFEDTAVYLLISVCRQKALDIYFKLHVDSPYLTRDKERQGALAEYTGQDTKQVDRGVADLDVNQTVCL